MKMFKSSYFWFSLAGILFIAAVVLADLPDPLKLILIGLVCVIIGLDRIGKNW